MTTLPDGDVGEVGVDGEDGEVRVGPVPRLLAPPGPSVGDAAGAAEPLEPIIVMAMPV